MIYYMKGTIMSTNIKRRFSKRSLILILLIIVALTSVMAISKVVSEPSFNEATIKSLDGKKITVMKLAAATAASSTALSLLPSDIASPIANQLAELSKYFIFILGAIVLEKMLVAVVGYIAFTYIIPAACFLAALHLYIKADWLRVLAIKLAIFGIVIFIAVPASVKVSDLIYSSYENQIEQTVETAEENKNYIEEKKKEFSAEDEGWLSKVGGYLSNVTSKIGSGVTDIIKKGEDTLSSFLDAIAILIVTTCVIPLIVLMIFIWVTKMLFGSVLTSSNHPPRSLPKLGSDRD